MHAHCWSILLPWLNGTNLALFWVVTWLSYSTWHPPPYVRRWPGWRRNWWIECIMWQSAVWVSVLYHLCLGVPAEEDCPRWCFLSNRTSTIMDHAVGYQLPHVVFWFLFRQLHPWFNAWELPVLLGWQSFHVAVAWLELPDAAYWALESALLLEFAILFWRWLTLRPTVAWPKQHMLGKRHMVLWLYFLVITVVAKRLDSYNLYWFFHGCWHFFAAVTLAIGFIFCPPFLRQLHPRQEVYTLL